jgi:hypothetical protein
MTGAATQGLFNSLSQLVNGAVNTLIKTAGPQARLSRPIDSTNMVALVVGALLIFLGVYLL